jgi:hypothetical protein
VVSGRGFAHLLNSEEPDPAVEAAIVGLSGSALINWRSTLNPKVCSAEIAKKASHK